jgi:hypothetical protein
LNFLFVFLTPRRAVEPPVPRPNLHGVMVRSLVERRGRALDGIDKRAGVDLFVGFDAVASVEKMAAIQAHNVRDPKKCGPSPVFQGRAGEDRKSANEDSVSAYGVRQLTSKVAKI